MPVAWDCDLLLKSVVPSFPEIKMSGDAADSTDTRHEPDQVEPGKEGLGHGGAPREGKGSGGLRCWNFLPVLCSCCCCLASFQPAGELIKNALWARVASVSRSACKILLGEH